MNIDGTRSPLGVSKIDPSQLVLPEGMRFACQCCGRCCEDFWEIPLDEDSLARLKSLPLADISPKFLDPAQWTQKSPRPDGDIGLRLVSKRCIFLDSERRCVIHGNFGAAAKPQICQDFPFRYVRTPRGIFVGASLACPSIRANCGQPLIALREALANMMPSSYSIATVTEPIELSAGLPICFETYEQVEACLSDLLKVETLSLDDRLIAGCVFLQMIDRTVRQMGEAAQPDDAVLRLVEIFRKDQFRRVMAIASKARGSTRLHRALVGLLITYRSAFDERQRSRLGRTSYLIYQYVRYMGGLGSAAMLPLENRVPLSRMRTIRADWTDTHFVNLLERFCQHSLFRKDAIVSTPLLKGYGLMLLFVALMRWYALAFSATNQSGAVGRSDFDEAVAAVEKYYCFHTDFMRLFDHYPGLRTIVERLVSKPVFAPSILRPKGP